MFETLETVAALSTGSTKYAKSWRTALAASTSAIALATVCGSEQAQAAEQCGAPVGDVVNCAATDYPTGINYFVSFVDDLTVNVGSFAGQDAAVTVDGPIIVLQGGSTTMSQTLNVGSNVTVISTGYGEEANARSYGNYNATATLTNNGVVKSTDQALYAYAEAVNDPQDVITTSTISNTGAVTSSGTGVDASTIFAKSFTATYGLSINAMAYSSITNSGSVTRTGSGGSAIYAFDSAWAVPSANGAAMSASTATSYVDNSGGIEVTGSAAEGIFAHSFARAGYNNYSTTPYFADKSSASATATVVNSGAITTTTGYDADGIEAKSVAIAVSLMNATAYANASVINSAAITTSSAQSFDILASSNASNSVHDSTGVATATATTSVSNTGALSASGGFDIAGIDVSAKAHSSGYYDTTVDNNFYPYHATAHAAATITNSGAITVSNGQGSWGIFGYAGSGAFANAYAIAGSTLTITNSGAITLSGDNAQGILGEADVHSFAGAGPYAAATASASITNSGAITDMASYQGGIEGLALAYATSGHYGRSAATMLVDNSGAISASGKFASDINAAAASRSEAGITSYAAANLSVINSGPLSTTGYSSTPIFALSFVQAGVSVAYASPHYYHTLAKATASTYVDNSGAITGGGNDVVGVVGIVARSEAYGGINAKYELPFPQTPYSTTAMASSGVVNSGAITITSVPHSGRYAPQGIYAISLSVTKADVNATAQAYTSVANSGAISITGDDGIGIAARSKANATADYATANATSAINNTGALTMAGTGSVGALYSRAAAYAHGDYQSTATASASIANSGAVSTDGEFTNGLYAKAFTHGYASFGNPGTSAYSHATITNSGAVTTTGQKADGISLLAEATENSSYSASANANAAATNSGAIVASGLNGYGISVGALAKTFAEYENSTTATASVTNSGSITTTGRYSDGITVSAYAVSEPSYSPPSSKAYTTASATVSNSAAINTGTPASDAIHAYTYAKGYSVYGGTSSATTAASNSGPIATTGDDAWGMAVFSSAEVLAGFPSASHAGTAFAEAYATTTVANSGQITTSGDFAIGFNAEAAAFAGRDYVATTAATTDVANSGSVVTSGYKAQGIHAIASSMAFEAYNATAASTTSATNSGSISTSGKYAYGMVVGSTAVAEDAVNGTAIASASVTNSGSITTTGGNADGIRIVTLAESDYGEPKMSVTSTTVTTNVTNSGTITTSGYRSHGIVVYATALSGPANSLTGKAVTNITNSGTIEVSGKYADGIIAGTGAVYTGASYAAQNVINSGKITASGLDGHGVIFASEYANFTNKSGGSIVGGTGNYGFGVYATYAHELAIDNAGSISSANNQAIGVGRRVKDGTIYNQSGGFITGFITAHAYSLTFDNAGTWVALGGNSDFTPSSSNGSSILVNTGKILVVGDQTITGLTEFENAGLLSLSATNANQGARPQFETVTITGDFVGEGGTVEVGSNMTTTADVLKVDGAISGASVLMVAPEGTPGLTTGNGILVVDATSATTSSSNFKIFSNDTVGTFVDGAYQFSLGLVPGAGGSGQWFLTSKPFNGVYQLGQAANAGLSTFALTTMNLPDLIAIEQAAPGDMAANEQTVQVASNDNNFVPSAPQQSGLGGWGRYNYASLNVTPEGNSASDFHLRAEIGHFGVDHTIDGPLGQKVVIGFTAGPVSSQATFHDFGTRLDTNGFYLGGYSLYLDGPWTAGLLVNWARLDTHITDTFIDTDAKVRPDAAGIQAATSYRFDLDSGYTIEPWAQLSYASINGGGFMDGAGNPVTVSGTSDVDTQLGARVLTTFASGDTVFRPYATASFDYLFNASSTVSTLGFSAETNLRGATGHFGGGLDVNLTSRFALFGEADYIAGQRQTGWTGFLGLRYAQ